MARVTTKSPDCPVEQQAIERKGRGHDARNEPENSAGGHEETKETLS